MASVSLKVVHDDHLMDAIIYTTSSQRCEDVKIKTRFLFEMCRFRPYVIHATGPDGQSITGVCKLSNSCQEVTTVEAAIIKHQVQLFLKLGDDPFTQLESVQLLQRKQEISFAFNCPPVEDVTFVVYSDTTLIFGKVKNASIEGILSHPVYLFALTSPRRQMAYITRVVPTLALDQCQSDTPLADDENGPSRQPYRVFPHQESGRGSREG